ncbi:MAG: hypothetical protein AAGA20_23970 [Planctomycetota bacterium]
MPTRSTCVLAVASLALVASCSSKKGSTRAQEPVDQTAADTAPTTSVDAFELYGPDPIDEPEAMATDVEEPTAGADLASDDQPERARRIGPAPWTGAYGQTAVMVADTFRIEGPSGLLEHVVASSDDDLYERSVELTADGLMQIISRPSTDAPEIRVQIDRWSLAAMDRVVILERVDEAPVRLIGTGEAAWRDVDGRILYGERLAFEGAVGDESPFDPTTHQAFGRDLPGEPQPELQPEQESFDGADAEFESEADADESSN